MFKKKFCKHENFIWEKDIKKVYAEDRTWCQVTSLRKTCLDCNSIIESHSQINDDYMFDLINKLSEKIDGLENSLSSSQSTKVKVKI